VGRRIYVSRTRFPLKGRRGAQIESITIRETNGVDEELAAKQAKARGDGANDVEELVRLSIDEVDDKPVKQPFMGFDLWNSKTRGYALMAWKHVNAVPKEEEAGFIAGGEELA
jgi:hypothetical protein